MTLNLIPNEKPAAGTNGDGLDFVLLMATPPLTKGKADVYISAFDDFYKSLR